MSEYKLAERAVLMRIAIGLPGENRLDVNLTDDVKREHGLGQKAGVWVKALYPKEALKEIKQLDVAARAYHEAVTLPFDKGIGILPAPLVLEYSERMKSFAAKRVVLRDKFLADPQRWIDWAIKNHNGTFDPDLYPGCMKDEAGVVTLDVEEFREVMKDKFSFRTEPLPVPDAGHFTATISNLLGQDAEGVNIRVQDAMTEGMKELMRRLIEPVKAMAEKLVEEPKQKANGKMAEDICFRDTLIENIRDIASLAPKLNISGDPAIDQFAAQMSKLASVEPEKLRQDKSERAMKAAAAADLLKRLEGYSVI